MRLRTSDSLAISGWRGLDVRRGQVRVEMVRLHLEERPGPSPPRRVVSMTTASGKVYRFQRYGTDEPLVFYERVRDDGSKATKAANLPRHVEQVRDLVTDGEAGPTAAQMDRALAYVERDDDLAPAGDGPRAAAHPDGGIPEWLVRQGDRR